MSDEKLVFEGTVVRAHRGDVYEVDCVAGSLRRTVLARRSGRLNQNRIRVLEGDVVTVEVSCYDLTRGRIVFRGRREAR